MSLRAPLLLLTLAAFVFSRPAQAGRASACKAPPFAVPKETQRAVDAAIDARVVGTGAGGLATTVETRTDYETTTLSQDAAARAWTEYTLCLKLARKLISQELHDELLRELLTPPIAAPLEVAQEANASTPTSAPPPLAPQDLAGTWQVVTTFRWSTCPPPNDKAGVNAYSWLVSVGADDAVEAKVLGKTSYPVLSGRLHGDSLVLTGELVRSPVDSPNSLVTSDGQQWVNYRPSVFLALRPDGDVLQGTRELVTLVGPTGTAGAVNEYDLCVMRYDVRATR